MKEIQLTQGKVALVDDEDFEYLNQWKCKAHWGIRHGKKEGKELENIKNSLSLFYPLDGVIAIQRNMKQIFVSP